jgi:hypothetical protein
MLRIEPSNRGARIKGATKEDFVFPDSEEKFPRSTWELRSEVLLVDGVPHLPGANYSKKRMYIDPSTRAPALAGSSRSGFRPTGVVEGATGLPVGLHFKVNANLTIEDWITQSAMLRRARR